MKVVRSRMRWAGHVQRMSEDSADYQKEHGKQKRVAEEEEEDQSCDGKTVSNEILKGQVRSNGQEWKTIAEDRGKWRELTTPVIECGLTTLCIFY